MQPFALSKTSLVLSYHYISLVAMVKKCTGFVSYTNTAINEGQSLSLTNSAAQTVPLTFSFCAFFCTSSCRTQSGSPQTLFLVTQCNLILLMWLKVSLKHLADMYKLSTPHIWYSSSHKSNRYITRACNGDSPCLVYFSGGGSCMN